MDPILFYRDIQHAAALPPDERHARLSALHERVVRAYIAAITALTPRQVDAPPAHPSPGRETVGQVIAHIAEWERFALLAAGDLLAGLPQPRMVADLTGYLDPDGAPPVFQSTLSAHARPWPQILPFAIETARSLHVLFTHPHLLTAGRLERTLPFDLQLPGGARLPGVRWGWNLWYAVLEHEAVEHALDIACCE